MASALKQNKKRLHGCSHLKDKCRDINIASFGILLLPNLQGLVHFVGQLGYAPMHQQVCLGPAACAVMAVQIEMTSLVII